MLSMLLVRIRKYLGRLPIDHDAGNLGKPLNNSGDFERKVEKSALNQRFIKVFKTALGKRNYLMEFIVKILLNLG